MPVKCTPCLSVGLKALIKEALADDAEVVKLINETPDCPSGVKIELCLKRKRRSAYQDFISGCLKEKHLTGFDPGALSDCARQWREKKGA